MDFNFFRLIFKPLHNVRLQVQWTKELIPFLPTLEADLKYHLVKPSITMYSKHTHINNRNNIGTLK